MPSLLLQTLIIGVLVFVFPNKTPFQRILMFLFASIVNTIRHTHSARSNWTKRVRPIPSASNQSLSPADLCLSRKSVRSYDPEKKLTEAEINTIQAMITDPEKLKSPFGSTLRIVLVHKDAENKRFGTYGFIKGATSFLCVFAKEDANPLDIGVVFQRYVLEFTRMGFGTCWMAGTFSEKDFTTAAPKEAGERLWIVSPIGHGTEKHYRPIKETLGGFNLRKPFDTFFFKGLDRTVETCHLTEEEKSCPMGTILEAVRWAPSAVNSQPTRMFILPKSTQRSPDAPFSLDDPVVIHIFTVNNTRAGVDCGIAMENLRYVSVEQFNRKGHFIVIKKGKEEDGIPYPSIPVGNDQLLYWATWVEDS